MKVAACHNIYKSLRPFRIQEWRINLYLPRGMAHKSYNLLHMRGSINRQESIYPLQLPEYSPLAEEKKLGTSFLIDIKYMQATLQPIH